MNVNAIVEKIHLQPAKWISSVSFDKHLIFKYIN